MTDFSRSIATLETELGLVLDGFRGVGNDQLPTRYSARPPAQSSSSALSRSPVGLGSQPN